MPNIEKDLDGTTTITYLNDDIGVPTDENGYKISMTILHGKTICHVVSPETILGRKFTLEEKQEKDTIIWSNRKNNGRQTITNKKFKQRSC